MSLYDRTGSRRQRIETREPKITALSFDPLNRGVLASGGSSGYLKLWNTKSKEALLNIRVTRPGGRVLAAFNPFLRDVVAVAGDRDRIGVWDVLQRRRLRTFPTGPHDVTLIAYDLRTANTLAVVSKSGVAIFDTSNGKKVRRLKGSPANAPTIAFDPLNRNTVAIAFRTEGLVGVWDVSNGRMVRRYRVNDTGLITSLAFNPLIRNSLAIGTADGLTRIVDATTGNAVHSFPRGRSAVTSLAFAQGGDRLAIGSGSPSAPVWKIEDW